MRIRVLGWMLAVIGAGVLSGGSAHGKEGDVTSRDIEKAFRTLRKAISRGAEAPPFGKPQVLKLIGETGGSNVSELQESLTSYVFEERKIIVVFYEDGDLQLRYHQGGGTWDTVAANEWNRTRRVGKCYRLDDGSVVLEYTLLAPQGPSDAWFTGAMTSFHDTLGSFVAFLNEKNQDGDK